mgnify:CR=1 FL=1
MEKTVYQYSEEPIHVSIQVVPYLNLQMKLLKQLQKITEMIFLKENSTLGKMHKCHPMEGWRQ